MLMSTVYIIISLIVFLSIIIRLEVIMGCIITMALIMTLEITSLLVTHMPSTIDLDRTFIMTTTSIIRTDSTWLIPVHTTLH